jgi:hypothetical protein
MLKKADIPKMIYSERPELIYKHPLELCTLLLFQESTKEWWQFDNSAEWSQIYSLAAKLLFPTRLLTSEDECKWF